VVDDDAFTAQQKVQASVSEARPLDGELSEAASQAFNEVAGSRSECIARGAPSARQALRSLSPYTS